MQFFKLLVAMSALVSAQHDASKCFGDSEGPEKCCASSKFNAYCLDSYVSRYEQSEKCTYAEALGSGYERYYCEPPTEDNTATDDYSDVDFSADLAAASGAAATGLVTILLLWILTPVIICVCICVCICACSKTCCFAQKQAPVQMQPAMNQPQMMAPK